MRCLVVLVLWLGLGTVRGHADCPAQPGTTAELRAAVSYLASPELGGRVPGSDGDRAARAWIAERMTCAGLTPIEQAFKSEGDATANVFAKIAGISPAVGDEIILVAAHFDHLGDGHLGANDNASGIAAMLAVAHAIGKRELAAQRTIVFAAFGAEERGMHGSYYFARNMPAGLDLDKIVQVINLDMVGTHSSRGFVTALGTFPKVAATRVLAKLEKRYKRLAVAKGGKARGSDYEPFCNNGTPYVFFWTPDKRCYHKTCDVADKLDYERMVDIAALATDLTNELADTSIDLAGAKATYGCYGTTN